MATDIKRLLNKKKLTGEEIGKALIMDTIASYRSIMTTGEDKSLFSQAEFNDMVNGITNSRQGEIYNCYVALLNFTQKSQSVAITYKQEAQIGYFKLLNFFERARSVEQYRAYQQELPAIMTEKQYNELTKRREDEQGEIKETLHFLLRSALEHHLSQRRESPKKRTKFNSIINSYKKEIVTNARILAEYNKIWGNGYNLFPDGKRSDTMTASEYKTELKKYSPFDKMGIDYLDDNDIDSTTPIERLIINMEYHRTGNKDIFLDEQEHIEQNKDLTPIKWVVSEVQPKNLTKYDIITDGSIDEYYGQLWAEYDGSPEAETQLQEFISDFPDLYKFLREDIQKQKGLEFTKDLTEADAFTEIASWGELSKNNIYNFNSLVSGDATVFDGNHRALFNGIAIVRPSDILSSSYLIDENGDYKEPANPLLTYGSLESLINDPESVAIIDIARAEITEGLRNTFAFNTLYELIAERIGIPDYNIFKTGCTNFIGQIEALNTLVILLYDRLTGTSEEIAAKREIIKRLFQPIDITALQPTQEAKEEVAEQLEDLKIFNNINVQLTNQLAQSSKERGANNE